MATIHHFEELEAWQRARLLTQAVYRASATGRFAKDYALKDQIRRSAISAMSNIAEGFERDGDREFCYFLSVAKGSCGELRSQLFVAFDQEYLGESRFHKLCQETCSLSRLLFSLMIRESEMRGRKYKA